MSAKDLWVCLTALIVMSATIIPFDRIDIANAAGRNCKLR